MTSIICKDVETHNLKKISTQIPLYKLTAVTGVSGSGKSSLVFDTIFAESQRRFLETLGTYERQFLQGLPQGTFGEIENIPAAVALKQSNKASSPRSLVMTSSDLQEPLKTLFLGIMEPSCTECGEPVTVNDIQSLIDAINSLSNKQAVAFCAEISLPQKKSSLNVYLETILREGYSKCIVNGILIDTNDLLTEKHSAEKIFIVLDHLVTPLPKEDLINRLTSVWSQIVHSSQYHFISVFLLSSNKNYNFHTKIIVQPYCECCKKPTKIIQGSDLDWQSALGACRNCEGLGNVPLIDETKIIPNTSLSISDGCIKPWSSKTFEWFHNQLIANCKSNKIKVSAPYQELSQDEKDFIWSGNSEIFKKSKEFVSVLDFFSVLEKERYKPTARIFLAKYRSYNTCQECQGERLGAIGRRARCHQKTFPDLMASEVIEVLDWVKSIKKTPALLKKREALKEIINEVEEKLSLLTRLGLGSLQLGRRCKTLSGGEFQRVLLSRVIGNGLTDALYVLDEPSVGLGRAEIDELIKCLHELKNLGNTVLLVEHDPEVVRAADHVIELGPGGGSQGGALLYSGNDISKIKSIIFPNIKKENPSVQTKKELVVKLKKFSLHNISKLSVKIQLEKLTVIHGRSGAGKSTLLKNGLHAAIEHFLESNENKQLKGNDSDSIGTWEELVVPEEFAKTHELIAVEQKAMHRAVTSIPATILGVMDSLRKIFSSLPEAKEKGLSASDFSFNGSGGCETCEGKGFIKEDLFFLGEVEKICPECHGTRFRNDIQKIYFQGKNISQWLSSSIFDCYTQLKSMKGAGPALLMAIEMGLGHLPLGVSTTQISGGEAQRLRLTAALIKSDKKLFCLLDEPTRGLSEIDVSRLIETLLKLTAKGHTFVVVEHHRYFIDCAHHTIEMGPGSGKNGGKIVFDSLSNKN